MGNTTPRNIKKIKELNNIYFNNFRQYGCIMIYFDTKKYFLIKFLEF